MKITTKSVHIIIIFVLCGVSIHTLLSGKMCVIDTEHQKYRWWEHNYIRLIQNEYSFLFSIVILTSTNKFSYDVYTNIMDMLVRSLSCSVMFSTLVFIFPLGSSRVFNAIRHTMGFWEMSAESKFSCLCHIMYFISIITCRPRNVLFCRCKDIPSVTSILLCII